MKGFCCSSGVAHFREILLYFLPEKLLQAKRIQQVNPMNTPYISFVLQAETAELYAN